MSQKKEVQDYISENLKKGYTKEQIKKVLLNKYPEKLVKRQLLEIPDPRLHEKFKNFNYLLIFFISVDLLRRFYMGFSLGLTKGGIVLGLIVGVVTLILPGLFLVGVIKARVWGYLLFAGYGIINLFNIIVGYIALFRDPAVNLSIFSFFIIFFEVIVLIGMSILAIYCWKNIHPNYKFKNLFTV